MKQKFAYKRRKHLFISSFNQKQYILLYYITIRLEYNIQMHVSTEKIKKYFKHNVCSLIKNVCVP